jgi:hypothetical protein
MCIKRFSLTALVLAITLAGGEVSAQQLVVKNGVATNAPAGTPLPTAPSAPPKAAAAGANLPAGNLTGDDLKRAAPYTEMAAALGAPVLAHGLTSADRKTQLLLEYLPSGDTIANWSRMVSVNEAVEDNADSLAKVIASMRKIVTTQGKAEFFTAQDDKNGRPTASFCYNMGVENTCGIIGEITPNVVTILQLQKRNNAIGDEDRKTLQGLLAQKF